MTARTWFGPFSLVGVGLGLSLVAMSLLVDSEAGPAWGFLPPVVGAALLAVRGRVRQFGIGLVVSVLGAPVFLLGFFLAASALNAVGG